MTPSRAIYISRCKTQADSQCLPIPEAQWPVKGTPSCAAHPCPFTTAMSLAYGRTAIFRDVSNMLPRPPPAVRKANMTIEMLLIIPQIAFDLALAIAVLAGRTHGGLTFCRIGRFGFSFYVSRKG